MTFKSYSDHTEPIFNDLKILNLYKLNEYLTSSDIFICIIFQKFVPIILWPAKISIIITQEMHLRFTKNIIEQIIINTHSLTKESMCGIIFLCNIKKLDLFQYSKRQWKSIFFILNSTDRILDIIKFGSTAIIHLSGENVTWAIEPRFRCWSFRF
jgi:hypothetical protein